MGPARYLRKNAARIFLILSALIPPLFLLARPPEVTLLLYSLYVVAYFLRKKVVSKRSPGFNQIAIRTFASFLVTGTITEVIAWANNYLKAKANPETFHEASLFHPQLLPDICIGVGFYGGWALAWLLVSLWFRFTLVEAFLVTGLQGVFFEQLGAVFMTMLAVFTTNPILAIFLGIAVFLIHGSIAGLALSPLIHHWESETRSVHWARFPIAMALMIAFAFLGCWGVNLLAKIFGGLPAHKSIVEHPFW